MLNQEVILQPMAAMFVLTMAVWIYMYVRRISFMTKHGVDPQSVPTPELIAESLPQDVNNPSNNLKNLFELPVIFYAVCLSLLVSGSVDGIFVYAAWMYVAFRILHSAIQCTANIVRVRFAAYFMSSLVLWFMVIRFSIHLIS